MARVSKYAGQEKHSLWLTAWADDDLAFHMSLWGGEQPYTEDATTVLRSFDRGDEDNEPVRYQDEDPEGKHYDPPLYVSDGEAVVDPEDNVPVFVAEVPAWYHGQTPAPYTCYTRR